MTLSAALSAFLDERLPRQAIAVEELQGRIAGHRRKRDDIQPQRLALAEADHPEARGANPIAHRVTRIMPTSSGAL